MGLFDRFFSTQKSNESIANKAMEMQFSAAELVADQIEKDVVRCVKREVSVADRVDIDLVAKILSERIGGELVRGCSIDLNVMENSFEIKIKVKRDWVIK